MSTKTSETEVRIDERTRRAAVKSMTIVTLGDGEYKVYSGVKNAYVVTLVRGTCDCPGEEYNHPVDECKHRCRVEMEICQREIPDPGPRRLDVELATEARNRRPESETETDPEIVAPDGGAVIESNDGRPADCNCSPTFDDDGLGCWPCYRDGHETANPAVEDDENDENDENDETPARNEPADFGGGESTGVIDL